MLRIVSASMGLPDAAGDVKVTAQPIQPALVAAERVLAAAEAWATAQEHSDHEHFEILFRRLARATRELLHELSGEYTSQLEDFTAGKAAAAAAAAAATTPRLKILCWSDVLWKIYRWIDVVCRA